MQTILILTANPQGTSQLRLDQEVRDIEQGLERAKQRDRFVVKSILAVRPRDIQRAMLDLNPSIVHFSGHGTGDEGLVFEDETGSAKLVDGEALAGLFELFAEQVECVVLNGCYSEVQAEAISQHINYVIGMKKAIGDKAAIEFAVGFYDAIGSGKPIEFAYELGCIAIRLAGIPDQLTPILKKNPNPRFKKNVPIEEPPKLNDIGRARFKDFLIPSGSPSFVYKLLAGALVLLTVIGFPVYYFSTLKYKREYYNKIENFLVNNNWRDADQETKNLIRDLLGNPKKEIIETEDMKKINCDDIKQINKLWEKYSDRKFGFKSQLLQWEESARDFNQFAYKLGWSEQPNEEINYSKMKFDSITIHKKPNGYLPAGYDIDLGLPIEDFRTDNWFARVKSCLL